MAELAKKIYFKNSIGNIQSAKLYTTLSEVQNQGVPIIVDSVQAYMKYGELNDAQATNAIVKLSNGNIASILVQANIPYGQIAYTAPGNYTFAVPMGVSVVRVTLKAGGGGGGGGVAWVDDGMKAYGGNGGVGGLNINKINVKEGDQITISVGVGGTAGARNTPYDSDGTHYGGSGGNGGNSVFSTLVATGGSGGGGGMKNKSEDYGSDGGKGKNGMPAGAGGFGGRGDSGSGSQNGGNGSVLIEWGSGI